MATTKSVNITQLDASPRLPLSAGSATGRHRVFMDTVSVVDDDFDADGDIVLLAEVPSNAKIMSIKLFNDALDGGTDSLVNVGVYNGGTQFVDGSTTHAPDGLISEAAYGSVIATFQGAVVVGTELAFEARNITLTNNKVWEDAGLAADPKVPLRIGFTQTATVASAITGDVTVQITYAVD